jgi:hypothetical protein
MRRTSSRVRERVGFSGGLAENQTTGRCSDGSASSNKLNRQTRSITAAIGKMVGKPL